LQCSTDGVVDVALSLGTGTQGTMLRALPSLLVAINTGLWCLFLATCPPVSPEAIQAKEVERLGASVEFNSAGPAWLAGREVDLHAEVSFVGWFGRVTYAFTSLPGLVMGFWLNQLVSGAVEATTGALPLDPLTQSYFLAVSLWAGTSLHFLLAAVAVRAVVRWCARTRQQDATLDEASS
jgi:hypothetical protein